MRIIAGEYRGRKLIAPSGDTTRPTADRTRETLFSMLTSRIGTFEGLAVLDLFAGSGALGLEAMSRGASEALLVEQDQRAIKAIETNIRTLGLKAARLRSNNVMSLGPAPKAYDIVFADPPYGTNGGEVAIDKLGRLGWFAPSAWIALETEHKTVVAIKGYIIDAERKVGKAKITLLRPEGVYE